MNIHKSKLVRELRKDAPKAKYAPTIGEAKLWFRIINREVFNGEVQEFDEIEIRRRHGCWGECEGRHRPHKHCRLSLNHHMLSKKHFITVLAHEMVHNWEWMNFDRMTHGERFLQWKPRMVKFGIVLAETQQHPVVVA